MQYRVENPSANKAVNVNVIYWG